MSNEGHGDFSSILNNLTAAGPSSVVPVHIAQNKQNIQQARRQERAKQGVELETYKRRPNEVGDKSGTESAENSDSSSETVPESEDKSLLFATDGAQQMQRKPHNRIDKAPTDSYDPLENWGEYGEANAAANGEISQDVEIRRKATSSDTISSRGYPSGRAELGLEDATAPASDNADLVTTSFSDLPRSDKRSFLLLCLLYFLQGVPMGLAMGSLPFLLKDYLSYGQIGIFSLAAYPYSLKLLWSPIVDAIWSQRFGRRKSWIAPIQTISGMSLIWLGARISSMMSAAGENDGAGVWHFTGWWFLLVLLCATQDIAVDGWAISLISARNLSYASTAQTVGLTAGTFLSHTVFLALSTPDLANRWFRKAPLDYGLMTLGGYMTFWGWVYLIVTFGLVLIKRENKTKERDSIVDVYRSMWKVLKLKNIHTLIMVMLISKLGFVTNETVTSLKLLDKGFGQANLALVVLIDFPFEIGLGYYAGKWSAKYTPLRVWCWAFVARLIAAVLSQIIVMIYPANPVAAWYMVVVILGNIYSTFMNTVMFVSVSAFFARIADPAIGGTYMTMLATYVLVPTCGFCILALT